MLIFDINLEDPTQDCMLLVSDSENNRVQIYNFRTKESVFDFKFRSKYKQPNKGRKLIKEIRKNLHVKEDKNSLLGRGKTFLAYALGNEPPSFNKPPS